MRTLEELDILSAVDTPEPIPNTVLIPAADRIWAIEPELALCRAGEEAMIVFAGVGTVACDRRRSTPQWRRKRLARSEHGHDDCRTGDSAGVQGRVLLLEGG